MPSDLQEKFFIALAKHLISKMQDYNFLHKLKIAEYAELPETDELVKVIKEKYQESLVLGVVEPVEIEDWLITDLNLECFFLNEEILNIYMGKYLDYYEIN